MATEANRPQDEASTLVARLPLSESAELVLGISEFQGKPYGSFRKFLCAKRYSGPTQSGFALSKEGTQVLAEKLREVERDLDSLLRQPRPTEICRIPKNSASEIILQLVADEDDPGLTHLDARTYVQSKKFTGWTKKGFRFPVDRISELAEATDKLVLSFRDWLPAMPPLFRPLEKKMQPVPTPVDSPNVLGVPEKYRHLY